MIIFGVCASVTGFLYFEGDIGLENLYLVLIFRMFGEGFSITQAFRRQSPAFTDNNSNNTTTTTER